MNAEALWSKNHFALMAMNGTWAVPRSGLIFQKTGPNTLALINKMPWMPEMAEAAKNGKDVPATKEALEEYQNQDFECIASRFREAGIEVINKTRKETV